MTTYEEISTCPVKNWEYWSDKARFHLIGYITHRGTWPASNTYVRAAKAAFRSAMKNRRNREYLEAK